MCILALAKCSSWVIELSQVTRWSFSQFLKENGEAYEEQKFGQHMASNPCINLVLGTFLSCRRPARTRGGTAFIG